MKRLVFALALCFILSACAKKEEPTDDYAGGNMQYDLFRGSSSSIVNRVQLEAFDKCLQKFDFSKYKGKVVATNVYAANDHVKEQILSLLNISFIKNGILTPKQEIDKKKSIPPKYDYSLEVNAVCGGYHFYPGFIFYNYQSTARVVLLEKTPKGETHFFDSSYQETSLFLPVFTQEFRTSIYIIIFAVIAVLAYRFGAFSCSKQKEQ